MAHVPPGGKATFPVVGYTAEKVIRVPSTGAPPTIDAAQVVDEPTMRVDGAQEAETDGDAFSTVIVVGGADVLGLLLLSPLKVAFMVVEAVEDGV